MRHRILISSGDVGVEVDQIVESEIYGKGEDRYIRVGPDNKRYYEITLNDLRWWRSLSPLEQLAMEAE